MLSNQNIFITGGNRGIGLGLLKGLCGSNNVIFSVRDKAKGEQALEGLNNLNADYVVMDVDDTNSIEVAVGELKNKLSTVDILFNNAGILLKEYDVDVFDTSESSILKAALFQGLFSLQYNRPIQPPCMDKSEKEHRLYSLKHLHLVFFVHNNKLFDPLSFPAQPKG